MPSAPWPREAATTFEWDGIELDYECLVDRDGSVTSEHLYEVDSRECRDDLLDRIPESIREECAEECQQRVGDAAVAEARLREQDAKDRWLDIAMTEAKERRHGIDRWLSGP